MVVPAIGLCRLIPSPPRGTKLFLMHCQTKYSVGERVYTKTTPLFFGTVLTIIVTQDKDSLVVEYDVERLDCSGSTVITYHESDLLSYDADKWHFDHMGICPFPTEGTQLIEPPATPVSSTDTSLPF